MLKMVPKQVAEKQKSVLWQFDIACFILTIIEMNMILFCVWITAQSIGQNVCGKGDNYEYPGIKGRKILKYIFNKWEDLNWIRFSEKSEY
jgi:hypothetical protein